jgi:DNA-binding response OmpR family regulator
MSPKTESNLNLILIVDDYPNVRLVFRTALESGGYRVAEAEDGEAALEWLARSTPDVILLDLQMPRLGGMEVLRRLRKAGHDVPVVIVTAHGSIPDAVVAMKLGAIDFLTKPLYPEALRQVVGEVIRRHSPSGTEPATRHDGEVELDSGLHAVPPRRPATATAVTLAPPVVDLTPIKRALNRREFDKALSALEEALVLAPDSAEAHTLMGVLRESLGQQHAAYHAYKSALEADPHYGPALDNMQRYCARYGLDVHNRAINPAAK